MRTSTAAAALGSSNEPPRAAVRIAPARSTPLICLSRYPEAPACLMLTSHSDDEALLGAIMAGASGYLLKQISGVDLVGAIRTAAQGGSLLDPSAAAAVLERIRRDWVPDDPRYATLSPQERRILDLIADGRTNRQIGAEMHLAEKTLKNYVSSLLHKLGVARRTEAAVLATELRRPGH